MNHSREERVGTIVCLLCRGMISFKSGDKTRFESHLQHEHEAYFGLDVLLAVSFIRDDERLSLVRAVSPGYGERSRRIDLKLALNKTRSKNPEDHWEATFNYSDFSSDYSVDDNDKIYGIPEPILKCNKCSRTFVNILSLRRHEKQHIEQNYSCNECGERFAFLEDLKQHRVRHQENDTVNEDHNDMYVVKDTDSRDEMAQNSINNTTDNNETQVIKGGYLRCKFCLKIMKRESYLAHKLLHKNDRKIECTFCGSKFRKHDQLKKHVHKVHRSNESIQSLSFSDEVILSCTICNKKFQNEYNLTQHMQVHFPQGLKQHIPSQSSLFSCNLCTGKFSNNYDLEDHINEVHKELPLSKENYYLPMK